MKKYLTLFQDVKFNIYLFCVLAAASITGTLLPQSREVPEKVLKFVESHPMIGPVLGKAGFFDLYYSWWFIALLSLMAFDVFVCKIIFGKFPGGHAFSKWERDPASIENLKFKGECASKLDPEKFCGRAADELQKSGFGILKLNLPDGSVLLLAAKHKIQRYGSWVSHIALLLILLANVAGLVWGFRETLEIPEGESVSMTRRPWSVECEKFTVDFYDNAQTPRTFASDLRVFKETELLTDGKVLVNEPLEYKNVRFYQATYAPYLKHAKIGLFMKKNPEKSTPPMLIKMDESVSVPGTPYQLKVLNFVPDFYLDGNNKPASRSPNLSNPAVKLLISKNGQPVKSPWIFVKYPGLQMPPFQAMDEFIPVLAETAPLYVTGIQAAYDPGAGFFWMGCSILVGALMILFYLHYRRIWVWVRKGESGKTLVKIGGASSRGKSFEMEFTGMLDELKAIS